MQGVHVFMSFRFLSRNIKKVTLCFSTTLPWSLSALSGCHSLRECQRSDQ